jgi:hypothetical protein
MRGFYPVNHVNPVQTRRQKKMSGVPEEGIEGIDRIYRIDMIIEAGPDQCPASIL